MRQAICGRFIVPRRSQNYADFYGTKFGRLTVVGHQMRHASGRDWPIMDCVCDCGEQRSVQLSKLKSAQTVSCGCYAKENAGKQNVKHGMTGSPTFKSWCAMKQRCNYPKAINYADYGGRGIRVCEAWNNSFEAFYADMGERPEGGSIERIDANGNYEPSNCRWATRVEQADNTRATNHIIYKGQKINLSEAARLSGLRQSSIRARLSKGWTVEQALETPRDVTQGSRNKSNNHIVSYKGQDMVLRAACEIAGVGDSHVRYYMRQGMNCDEAIGRILGRRKPLDAPANPV